MHILKYQILPAKLKSWDLSSSQENTQRRREEDLGVKCEKYQWNKSE